MIADMASAMKEIDGPVEGLVNKIIPFSSVDGPGNRTAIFLQGCNFDCQYCHNPETIHLCVGCGACVEVCPTGALTWEAGAADLSRVRHADMAVSRSQQDVIKDRQEKDEKAGQRRHVVYDLSKCVLCDACIKTCPHGSSPRIRRMTAEQVMQQVRRQMPYIRGITVSGGECTRQRDFLVDLFALAQAEGLNCLLDSNGSYDFSQDPQLMAVTDGVMLDIKAFSPEDHRTVTGRDNELVLQNARYLASVGKLPEIRTVVVPGLFDAEETVTKMAEMLAPYLEKGAIRYKLIKYRPLGVRAEYAIYPMPDDASMEKLKQLAVSYGFTAVIA